MRRKSGTWGLRGEGSAGWPQRAAQSSSLLLLEEGEAGSGEVNLSRCPPGQTQAIRFPRAAEMRLGSCQRGSGPEGGQDLAAAGS